MINGYSIRKCVREVGIRIPTSFYWRRKILDDIRAYMDVGSVSGVIEVDQAFFRLSCKGNHKISTTFTMPRKSYKRGVKGSKNSKDEKRKRGISKQQVCILCAMDRAGNIITELICKGRMKHTELERLFKDRIDVMPSIVNSRSGWIDLMELQLNIFPTICIGLSGYKSLILKKILSKVSTY